jgi:predicted phosphoadenosine phosphosulfate sulfurtransferase
MQRVKVYCETWEMRCYFNGIPDEAITSLEKINRVPSYKSIAIAILKNDLLLRSLGFAEEEGQLAKDLRTENKISKIQDLFNR